MISFQELCCNNCWDGDEVVMHSVGVVYYWVLVRVHITDTTDILF